MRACAIYIALVLTPTSANAHGADAERGLVMLLPTEYYAIGAAFVVAASFALLCFRSDREITSLVMERGFVFPFPRPPRLVTSACGLGIGLFLVTAGFSGSRDPLANPLPTIFWTGWWASLPLLQACLGNAWFYINPWTAALALVSLVTKNRLGSRPLLSLPKPLGMSPAIAIFAGFAWYELISLMPYDPAQLATVIFFYWLFVLLGMIVFGERAWAARAEPFTILFAVLASLAPLQPHSRQATGKRMARAWSIGFPGRALVKRRPMATSGILFLLLVLSSISFDGLSRTFTWLDFIGINPLEFPGRSAVMTANTLGLLGTAVVLAALYFGAVWFGCALAGSATLMRHATGQLIYSIVPISIGFHAAHYMPASLLEWQYAAKSLSDPFSRGWNLFSLATFQPTASFFQNIDDVTLIWNAQVLIVCLVHILAVVIAHVIALRIFRDPKHALLSQLPLIVLMIFYTVFGLWLLSTPTGT